METLTKEDKKTVVRFFIGLALCIAFICSLPTLERLALDYGGIIAENETFRNIVYKIFGLK